MSIWDKEADALEKALTSNADALMLHYLQTAPREAIAALVGDALPATDNTRESVISEVAVRIEMRTRAPSRLEINESREHLLGANTAEMPISIEGTLRASAKRLRLGIEGPLNADALDAFADSCARPVGYTLQIVGTVNHEFFLPTANGAQQAGKDAGYVSSEYRVVPLVPLNPLT